MSNLEILTAKLTLLRAFYQLTTAPFLEIKRKIEANEEKLYRPSAVNVNQLRAAMGLKGTLSGF